MRTLNMPSATSDRWQDSDFVARLDRRSTIEQLLVERQLEDAPRAQSLFPIGATRTQLLEQVVCTTARPRQLLATRGLQRFQGTEICDGDHLRKTECICRPETAGPCVSPSISTLLNSL